MRKRQKWFTLGLLVILFGAYSLQIVGTSKQEVRLPILGFHHIADDKHADSQYPGNMWVAKLSDFEEQMRYLYEHGYHTLTLDEVYAWKQGKRTIDEKSVVLTFDDGFLSTIHYAEPILKKYGFQASVFAIGSQIEEHGAYDDDRRQHASLQDMKNSSLSFYTHTFAMHHKDKGVAAINRATEEELEADLRKSNELISSTYVAYPYGIYNERYITLLKRNQTRLAFGYHENRKASRQDHDYQLPRFSVNRYTDMAAFQAMLQE